MPCCENICQYLILKDNERNLVSATFHMISITLISMSLVNLKWFTIDGDICVPYLTLGQFFWYGYSDEIDFSDYDCISSTIVNMMRILILMCFMAIIFALFGFFLDIIGPKASVYRFMRKHAIPRVCVVLCVISTVGLSYYVDSLLRESLATHYPRADFKVSDGLGVCLFALAGGAEAIGLLHYLIIPHKLIYEDDQSLVEGLDDMEQFDNVTPPPPYSLQPPYPLPPPYSVSPPPYTP